MNNPDFSQSPERMALAKVLLEANETHNRWNHMPLENLGESSQRNYLAMADAAITHLGSGYRLPEANEANAERLAKALHTIDYPEGPPYEEAMGHAHKVIRGSRWLRAFHAAFAEPAEKPDAVFPGMPAPEPLWCRCGHPRYAHTKEEGCLAGDCACPSFAGFVVATCASEGCDDCAAPTVAKTATVPCPAMNGDNPCEHIAGHEGPHSQGNVEWEDDFQQKFPAKPRDIMGESERRRERQRMAWEMMLRLASGDDPPSHILGSAECFVDAYLEWRDADEAAAKERICKR